MGGECGEEGVGETEGCGEACGKGEGCGGQARGRGDGRAGRALQRWGGGATATWSPWSSSLTPESDHFGTSLPLCQPGIKSYPITEAGLLGRSLGPRVLGPSPHVPTAPLGFLEHPKLCAHAAPCAPTFLPCPLTWPAPAYLWS